MKLRLSYAFLIGLIMFSLPTQAKDTPKESKPLARINTKIITLQEFNKIYTENLNYFQYKAPTKQAVLDDLIKRELGIQEAKRLGLDKKVEVIERMNTVLYNSLLDKALAPSFEKIKITDENIKTYYKKNPEIRTSHIFVSLPQASSASDQKSAYDRIKKIYDESLTEKNMSFDEVAKKHSEGPSAAKGGDVDYQTKDKLDPAYYAAAVKLEKPGKISSIVRSQYGYHIIKLTGIKPWEEVDIEQVKRMFLEEEKTKALETYMTTLKNKAKISINESLLND